MADVQSLAFLCPLSTNRIPPWVTFSLFSIFIQPHLAYNVQKTFYLEWMDSPLGHCSLQIHAICYTTLLEHLVHGTTSRCPFSGPLLDLDIHPRPFISNEESSSRPGHTGQSVRPPEYLLNTQNNCLIIIRSHYPIFASITFSRIMNIKPSWRASCNAAQRIVSTSTQMLPRPVPDTLLMKSLAEWTG